MCQICWEGGEISISVGNSKSHYEINKNSKQLKIQKESEKKWPSEKLGAPAEALKSGNLGAVTRSPSRA